MKPIDIEERKRLQQDILDAVSSFCKEKGLRYSLACGTMLGAVRHKGYIPWDDDIDIYMPREDYEKLNKFFPDILSGRYEMASLERRDRWWNCFAKVYDNRTLVCEEKNRRKHIGVSIDVFPVDDVPCDEEEWLSFNRKRRSMVQRLRLSCIRFSQSHKWYKNVALVGIKLLFRHSRKRALAINDYIKSYNGKGSDRVFECCQGLIAKRPFPKRLFDDLKETEFEGKMYSAFADADTYLSLQYGKDYMTPPPPEKRTSLHTDKAYWT